LLRKLPPPRMGFIPQIDPKPKDKEQTAIALGLP